MQVYTYNRVMLLIVIYAGVMLLQIAWYTDGSVTTICDDVMIWDWYVDVDVNIVMSVFICSHKDNYYTIIPSIYVQLGDDVDWFI